MKSLPFARCPNTGLHAGSQKGTLISRQSQTTRLHDSRSRMGSMQESGSVLDGRSVYQIYSAQLIWVSHYEAME